MKVWLGVIGRACIEFAVILLLISFAAGTTQSLSLPVGGLRAISIGAASAALSLSPLAALITLFLAFFSFEQRVASRSLGWLGLFLLGLLLFSLGIGLRRMPLAQEAVSLSTVDGQALHLIPAGTAVQQGRVALFIGSYAGGEAIDPVAVDFASDYPRMAYAARSGIDASTGETEIQGRSYPAAQPETRPSDLIPEAALFAGAWIWDRLASPQSFLLALARAGGFIFLAIGLRFLCRITGWPLANALLAAAGLAGLMVLDAALSGSPLLGTLGALLQRMGFSLSAPIRAPLLLASLEALIGLALGAADLAAAPKARKHLDD
jgi:hypothetical protein